jgi:ankyrin repeat protein
MKAIIRQSLSCIGPLLDHLEKLDFDSFNMVKMDALQSDDKKNILHVAAQVVRDTEVINILDIFPIMEQLADSTDKNGTTPLIVACQHQNHLLARRLVCFKAKIDHIDDNGYSPIYWAAACGSAEMLKFFLVHGKFETLFPNAKILW